MVDSTTRPEAEHAWGIEHIEPTDLITLWPGDEAPTRDGVLAALQTQCRDKIEVVADPPPQCGAIREGEGHPLWTMIVQLPECDGHFPVPLVIWAESMRDIGEDTIRHINAERIKWVIGVETLLFPPDPCGHFVKLLRLLGRAAPESPGILDVNKGGWHLRPELDELLLPEENVISESILWVVHGIGVDAPPKPDSRLWIYTHGLARCGLPELEMLDVPHSAVGSATALVNSIAELIVESGIPDPGEVFEIGGDLAVTLHPWQAVAAHIDENLPGHLKNRTAHGNRELIGPGAVVCAAEPLDSQRSIWTWPQEVVAQMAVRGATAIDKTERAKQRQQQLARASWHELEEAFSALAPQARQEGDQRQAVFLVQAGFQKPRHAAKVKGEPELDDREHLWFEVKRFHRGHRSTPLAEAVLVNQPYAIQYLHPGDVAKIERGVVSDWQVLTRRGLFTPTNLDGLRQVIEQINAEAAT